MKVLMKTQRSVGVSLEEALNPEIEGRLEHNARY